MIAGPTVEKIVDANYRIAKPYGGGILGSPRRYQLTQDEHEAIGVMSEACDEYPALRALAAWAEDHGAPEDLLEALAAARHGARWAVEGRSPPEGHKPYRAGVDTSPHYRRGWNDRIAKRGEDYGRVFRSSVDGKPVVNHPEANAWRLGERQEYVKGWEDAEARIAALALPDPEETNEREGGA